VQNVGAGSLDVQLPWLSAGSGQALTSGFLPGQCQAGQQVSTTDGRKVSRPAGPCEFHLEHVHFHYKDLVAFSLYQVDSSGGIGAKIGNSLKESFCLGDDDYFGFGTAGPNGPRNYVGQPGCNIPATVGSGSVLVDEGVSPGWGDVYTWDTPGQFIDITRVPPGVYDLIEKTNPSNQILVAGPAQTCALTQLRLTTTTVSTLSTQASVPCPA
jgi:hypothetical protein